MRAPGKINGLCVAVIHHGRVLGLIDFAYPINATDKACAHCTLRLIGVCNKYLVPSLAIARARACE